MKIFKAAFQDREVTLSCCRMRPMFLDVSLSWEPAVDSFLKGSALSVPLFTLSVVFCAVLTFQLYNTHFEFICPHNTGYKKRKKSSVYFLICSQNKWTCGLLLIIYAAQVHHRHMPAMAKHRAGAATFSGLSYCHHCNIWERVTIQTFRQVSSPCEVLKRHFCPIYGPHLTTSPKGNVRDHIDAAIPVTVSSRFVKEKQKKVMGVYPRNYATTRKLL